MKHQRHFRNGFSLREVERIDALTGDLGRRAQLLDGAIAAEERHALALNPLDAGWRRAEAS